MKATERRILQKGHARSKDINLENEKKPADFHELFIQTTRSHIYI